MVESLRRLLVLDPCLTSGFRRRVSWTSIGVTIFVCVFLFQLYYFTSNAEPPAQPSPKGETKVPTTVRPPKPRAKAPIPGSKVPSASNVEDPDPNEEKNPTDPPVYTEETTDSDVKVKYFLERPLLPTPFIATAVAENFAEYEERTKKMTADWQLTNDKSMFIYSSHMNLAGDQVVTIAMHEGETHKWLKTPEFDVTKLKSPVARNLHCVFPDGTLSVGRLEEWKFESEFLWLIKCRISVEIERRFMRQGHVNYLLVEAPASITEASDVSEHVLGNIVVTADDRPNPDQPIKLMLCSSALSDKKAAYLKEWIEFYRLMGVEYFAIYDKSMDRSSMDALDPYIKAGIVRTHKWSTPGYDDTHRSAQIPAHNDCLYRYKDIAEWMVYVDVDEFIFPIRHNTIREVLEEYDNVVVGSIGVRGMLFGGPPGGGELVMEKFTKRAKVHQPKHWRSKFIGRAAYMTITAVHWGEGGREVDINANDTMRMNHYYNAHGVRYPMDGDPTNIDDDTMPRKFAAALKERLRDPPGL